MGFDQTDASHKIPNGITGGKNTASVAAAFFKEVYAGKDKPQFSAPDGMIWLTLDKRAITARGSVMLAGDTTPKDYRISEVFTVSNRPYAVSDLWNAPAAPAGFYVSHDAVSVTGRIYIPDVYQAIQQEISKGTIDLYSYEQATDNDKRFYHHRH